MAGSTAGVEVQLGARTYSLVPQRIGRIRRKLEALFTVSQLATGQGDTDAAEGVSERLYGALEVFIPDLAPRWELAGYGSAEDYQAKLDHDAAVARAREEHAEAMARWADEVDAEIVTDSGEAVDINRPEPELRLPEFDDPYDDARDKSPTPPQIIEAVEQIFQIHGGQRLVRLLDSTVGTKAVSAMLRTEMLSWAQRRSQVGLSENGASTSTPSTQPTQTPALSQAATPDGAAEQPTRPMDQEPPANAD